MTDDQITIGMQVMVKETQKSAPLNGAIGTVAGIREYDNAPVYTLEIYGATYSGFRAYDLAEPQHKTA